MKKRVAITGLGVVSPLGIGVEDYWRNLSHGVSGVRRITRYDASSFPVHIAAEVQGFNLSDHTDAHPTFTSDDHGASVQLDRRTQYALAAAAMAVRDAGLEGAGAWADASLYFGAGEGDNDLALLARLFGTSSSATGCDVAQLLSQGNARDFGLRDQLMEATSPASLIAARYGIQGEVTTCLTACAASAQAIGEAVRRIQGGECALALAGGAHAMTSPLDVLGFALLSALSERCDAPQRASRPFDRNRDGFVIGEGASVLVLEDWERARGRGAHIRAELIGYGTTSDAYRVTDMHPDARGAVAAITAALNDAALDAQDIGYVNAHGTSTIENDRAETLALHRALGSSAPHIPVSSTKSMTGHAVAAAGALELIATVLALNEQVVPPTINYETPDPECDLDYVPNRARAHGFEAAMSNSFGFGGQNVALVVRRASV
jgi:3-oxoacyl-[acyl-carrier-protein] synthase II